MLMLLLQPLLSFTSGCSVYSHVRLKTERSMLQTNLLHHGHADLVTRELATVQS